ncbi:MAG TPA: PilZ domain-containing protein [Bryobacteraceae bacterium]|nr:PilZ domain-containing protein [Bryobacteraceae bacterium]
MDWLRRKHERHRLIAPVVISWIAPDGKQSVAIGNSMDVSPYGMEVEVNAAIRPYSMVRVRLNEKEISNNAMVRHCRQLCCWFRIGLEFDGTLVSEDIPSLIEALTKLLPETI